MYLSLYIFISVYLSLYIYFLYILFIYHIFLYWASLVAQQLRICLQCRSHRRPGFDPWVGKIPWRRAWQLTPVFFPGESPWTEASGGLQSMDHIKSDTTEQLTLLLSFRQNNGKRSYKIQQYSTAYGNLVYD